MRASGVALACALFVVPSSARAGEYTVVPCSDGAVTERPSDGFFATSTSSTVTVHDTCSDRYGNQIGIELADLAVTSPAGIRFAVPGTAPNARIVSVAGTAWISATREDSGQGSIRLQDVRDDATLATLVTYDGWEPATRGLAFTAKPATKTTGISLLANCTSTCRFMGYDDPVRLLVIDDFTITLDDVTNPRAVFEPTGLLSGGAKSGVQILTFSGVDDDSGLKEVGYSEYGTTAVVKKAAGVCTHLGAAACPNVLPVAVGIDTDRIPAGPNRTISVTMVDAVGNRSAATSPPFTVAGSATPSPLPTPLAGLPTATPLASAETAPTPAPTPPTVPLPTPKPDLNVDGLPVPTTLPTPPILPEGPIVGEFPSPPNGFTPGKVTVRDAPRTKAATKLTKDFGDTLTLTGQLLHDGQPLPNVAVDVLRTLREGAVPERLASVTTDGSGVYRYLLTTTASATIEVAYPEHVGAGDYSASRTLELRVRAGVQLAATPGAATRGQLVRFSGVVRIDPFPARRPRVTIQVRSAYGWQDVATLRTGASGAFKWSHAFRTKGAFRFRAKVLSDGDLGALTSSSRPISLRIR